MDTVAVTGWVWLAVMVFELAETDTVTAGTVIAAVPDFVRSATEVAVNVTFRSLTGGVDGAVYVAEAPLAVDVGDTEPQGAAAHDTVQFTPLFALSLDTAADTVAVPPACSVAVFAKAETLIGGPDEPPLQPQLVAARNRALRK